jgi:hypothetical protein
MGLSTAERVYIWDIERVGLEGSARKMDPRPFDDQHNLCTNVFASVYIYSSQDAKRIGLRQ